MRARRKKNLLFQRSKRAQNKSMEKLECDKTITNLKDVRLERDGDTCAYFHFGENIETFVRWESE